MIEHAARAAEGQRAVREREGRADRATLQADAEHARQWAAKCGGLSRYYLELAAGLDRIATESATEPGTAGLSTVKGTA